MKYIKKIVIGIVVVAILVFIDQYTKALIVNSFQLHEQRSIVDGLLYLTYYQNTGAAFSMMDGFGMTFFAIITVIAIGAFAYLYMNAKDILYKIAYISILAGALGNLIDRMVLGYVRDFIGVYIIHYAFPIFNVADICITCGFALLLIWMCYEDAKEKKEWKEKSLQ